MDTQSIKILLLGDEGVGKSAFLSRLTRPTRKGQEPPPLQDLRDEDQPFELIARFGKKKFKLEFYDTAAPETYQLLTPDVFVLCYDVVNRDSLRAVEENWFRQIHMHFRPPSETPILLVGLRRDLRSRLDLQRQVLDPEEEYALAQTLRLDRYLECSAMTGELMPEVLEDIAQVAAKTTTSAGGASQGPTCVIL